MAIGCFVLGALAVTASDTPTPAPTATPGLRRDVERHVQHLLDRTDLPRFETTVEVIGHTPQEMFERHLEGFDPICGAGGGGAPSVAEMARVRPHGLPLFRGVDVLMGLAMIRKMGPDRFFVYRVVRPDGAHYYVREGRMPLSQLVQPGALSEPVAAFPDVQSATHAVWRFEHGFKTAEAPPPPPCKP